ncbi:hypothetical protein C900_03524 [Fulvivirga imtechensis AK7]|uniref:Uncharacterized protein n=1 Tax=Fulvivirga imtechensis AK7 TaxID=1237149 RepID=L8JQN9_9BACT|nr:hypothetical protein [Fulvivirga imtechensis]ELR70543.1 hypothetical protein C900_03524 [Fulvivirga imtechensis AK7]
MNFNVYLIGYIFDQTWYVYTRAKVYMYDRWAGLYAPLFGTSQAWTFDFEFPYRPLLVNFTPFYR